MPATVSLYLIAVWFCVGLFTSMGWTLGGWIMGKVCTALDRIGTPK